MLPNGEIAVDATIEKAPDSQACAIRLSSSDVQAWFGRNGRVPVVASMRGYTYRSSLAPMGGSHVLPVNAEVRRAAGVRAGDRVQLSLREDLQPRTVDVPADLAAALDHGGLRDAFDAMSFTHRKEWVNALLDAKRPQTRLNRIGNCIAALRKRPRRG